MSNNLRNPIFHDEEAARAWFEARIWPNGPFCPHCGETVNLTRLHAKGGEKGTKGRPGLIQCNSCREQFTVTVNTVAERSKLPLTKWCLAIYLLNSSKKGMSALQMHRIMGGSYKTAWFLFHRIREAMREGKLPEGLGGANKVVEMDETYVGGKEANKHKWKRQPGRQGGKGKAPVLSLVERDGSVRSFHVANVTAKTLRPLIVSHVNRASYIMTDDSKVYVEIGREFYGHGSVNHSAEEYVRAAFWHTNTVENYFSILKRGIFGVYHHVSDTHLHRYAAEFDFRYNHRLGLGFSDMERSEIAAAGMYGKRLTYRRPHQRPNV
jgi:transposase-like protein